MSSESEYQYTESSQRPSRSPSRSRSRSQSPNPCKRRRLDRHGSIDPSRVRRYDIEGKYSDGYRLLFNEHVTHTAARFDVAGEATYQHYTNQIGPSIWSPQEQATLFAALERLGKDSSEEIARAIATKSVPETRAFLLVLQDAAAKQGGADLMLRDIPAAVEVGPDCDRHLDEAAEALAWFQERLEATQEQERYGDLWLITPQIAEEIENEINGVVRPRTPKTDEDIQAPVDPLRRGVAGYVILTELRLR
jgi:RNA polymerase I-specific transcription initiation factor RRN5